MLVNSEGTRIGDLPGCYGIYTLIVNSGTLTDVAVDVNSISRQTYPKYSSGHGFCGKSGFHIFDSKRTPTSVAR